MTNFKLKLMFFLLNSLLTADIVHSRPYADNTTDIVIKFSNNNRTFNLPVQSNSDTLIVANDEQSAGEISKISRSELEAIVNAEQNRDEDMSGRFMKESKKLTPASNDSRNDHLEDIVNAEQDRDEDMSESNFGESEPYVLEISNEDAAGVQRQLNTTSPLLDKIIDAETDREDTLTDIQLRPEKVDEPRFEFLIAGKINDSDVNNKSVNVVSVNSLDRNNSDVLRKVDYVELVEVGKPSKMGENKSAYSFVNITGHEVDNDAAPDTRFSDVQTLFMACFGTLLPLLTVLFATLLIRCMCRRWCKKPSSSSVSDSSDKQDANHQPLKSPTEDGPDGERLENGEGPPANGSIFTMTLKNNHLIVETEERNDITKNGRETKMKYSPDNDGIFVVEVQQSTAYRPNNKSVQNSPPHDPQISTNQALIHRVPEEVEKKTGEDESERSSEKFDKDKALALSSTGLSISDLSMSSIGSHNVSYSYGSQLGYEQGPFGYPVYAGYDISKEDVSDGIIHDNSQEPLISKTPTDPDKPVVTAAIFKQDSIIGNDSLQGPVYCIEGSTDGPLLSDVQAREYSLQHLQDLKDKKLENGVAVAMTEKVDGTKNILSRADSLPVRLEAAPTAIEKNIAMETINENDAKDMELPKDMPKGKRASLPIIRTEVYESVKDAIRPSGSPKFEKLTNDMSPGESTLDSPPMITITEESESSKADISS